MMRIFIIAFLIGAAAAVLGVSSLLFYRQGKVSKATETKVVVDLSDLESGSSVEKKDGITNFSLYSETALFETGASDASPVETAYELLEKPIEVKDGNVQGAATVRGADTGAAALLPPQISKQLRQSRTVDDAMEASLKKIGRAARRNHIKFTQEIDGVTVFGASVAVHIADDKKVYAMSGSVISGEGIKEAKLDEAQGRAAALTFAAATPPSRQYMVESVKEILFNPALITLSKDSNTYPAFEILVSDTGTIKSYYHRLYISRTDGSLLFDDNLMEEALNRMVRDCARSATCTTVRTEGSQPSNIADADSTYNHFGTIYNYYFNTFGRDSYNNAGSILDAFVNLPDSLNGINFCPNAAWLIGQNVMYICPGLAVLDILAHEVTHGVTSEEVGFVSLNQSGALSEAISDMVGVTVDDDWQFAEETNLGTVRNIDDPKKNSPPMPDRLFDSAYYCGTDDNGGIHINMSIPTKAFYLMAAGGQFNGCTMTGIGKDKAMRIWYQAFSRYMTFTSNFRDAYNAVTQACADLYGAGSADCITTQSALQATEMDQQPLNTDPVTRCEGATPRAATCINTVTPPTATPTSVTPPTATPTTVTPSITGTCATGDANCNGKADMVDFELWRRAFLKLSTDMSPDFNKDGNVNLTDFEIWRRAFVGL